MELLLKFQSYVIRKYVILKVPIIILKWRYAVRKTDENDVRFLICSEGSIWELMHKCTWTASISKLDETSYPLFHYKPRVWDDLQNDREREKPLNVQNHGGTDAEVKNKQEVSTYLFQEYYFPFFTTLHWLSILSLTECIYIRILAFAVTWTDQSHIFPL